ncbi:RNA-binding protein 7 [Cricetulus griseus]|uniref:RNA-binding protein 7 n=1 Tax=Cricetulus griseus TaxID=10029 RepID=G3HX89_CRIGR|nr:RNA-binding protein 7 [Cricetulus griseus]
MRRWGQRPEADHTLFVGNLETKVAEELLLELIHQAGPVIKVKIPKVSYGGKFGSLHADQSGLSPSVQSHGHTFNQSSSSQWRQDALSLQRKRRNSHPYLADRPYSCEQRYSDHGSSYHYRGGGEDFCYDDRNHDGWGHDYDNRRDSSRGGKWTSSRH